MKIRFSLGPKHGAFTRSARSSTSSRQGPGQNKAPRAPMRPPICAPTSTLVQRALSKTQATGAWRLHREDLPAFAIPPRPRPAGKTCSLHVARVSQCAFQMKKLDRMLDRPSPPDTRFRHAQRPRRPSGLGQGSGREAQQKRPQVCSAHAGPSHPKFDRVRLENRQPSSGRRDGPENALCVVSILSEPNMMLV